MFVKLIIFDLDGTLVNSIPDITDSINYSLQPYGFKRYSVDEMKLLVGGGTTALIDKLLGEEKAHLKEEITSRFLDYYYEHIVVKTRPYPGVMETLEALSDYKKCVLSNKREAFSVKVIEELGLGPFFESVLGSDSVAEKKPSPKPVLHLLSHFKLDPSEAIMVGDSEFDIKAGKGAGLNTVAVTYGYREKESLVGADFIIDDIRELPGIVNSKLS